MNAKQIILNKIKDGTFLLLTDDEIAHRLRLGRREALALRDMLHALCREGELLCDSRYRYGTAEQFHALRGRFVGNERGFGFFVRDDGGEDLFIPARRTMGALHGDTVLAIPVLGRSGDEGEILAVIERGMKRVVGTYRRAQKGGYVQADERKYTAEIFIPAGKNAGCASGAKVVVKLAEGLGAPHGEVIEKLGQEGDFLTEELSIIRAHGLYEEFPKEAEEEARRQAARPHSPSDLKGRMDLRDRLIITVDGEDTRDIDDAISVEEHDGVFELGVHIADVTHYVARNGVIDREAFQRGTSVYFPDRVLPMLPKALSNDICSLNEGVDRLTLSCLMTIDEKGKVIAKRITPSVIRSVHRMTYHEVTGLYEGDRALRERYSDVVEMIASAIRLTKLLQGVRTARGGIDMDIKEAKILYRDGEIAIPDHERTISHEMIEQFMVLANESVAQLMTQKKMPFIYRVHESPSQEKAQDFATFLSEAGIRPQFRPGHVSPKDYQKLLRSLETSALYPIVNRVMLRSMMKAIYSPENIGHFGLASDCYCHFTSPIRRYPDLCIHRIIKESFSHPQQTKERYQGFVEEASVRSSQCERNAAEAEREVDALYIVAYMEQHIGTETEATISGVTSFGIFAEMDNTVEGFIPIQTLPDDYYEYIEARYMLKGTRMSFRLGERLRVRVDGVDWGMRRTQFSFMGKVTS